jgi:nucleotide-binding universal stress UspA family protein
VSPNLTVVLEKGDPVDAIMRTAEAHDCGLIVAGVARDELLGRFTLGSTVSRLVRRSHTPVLVVRKRGQWPYRHIVVATDFSDSSRHALEAAVRFFSGTVITLFNAYDAPMSGLTADAASYQAQFLAAAVQDGEAFLKLADLTGWQGQRPQVLTEYGEPEQLICEYVRDKAVDLVALGSHGRSALFDVVIGGVAQGLVSSLPCDVLVVREPRTKGGA